MGAGGVRTQAVLGPLHPVRPARRLPRPRTGRGGRPAAVAAVVAALLMAGTVGLLVRGPWARPGERGHPAAGPAPKPLQVPPVILTGSPAERIAGLQARLRALPGDWRSSAALGAAYVQQARITADPTWYPKAQGVLARSLRLNEGQNGDAMIAMASLAAARHDFSGSLEWGLRAGALNPSDADALAVIGDAQLELGRYGEAFATFQKMIALKPSLSSYARVSYAWELQGSTGNAIRAMNLALRSAGDPTDAAWAANQLGELYWNSGQVPQAEAAYRRAGREDPSFLPPRVGLAKVAFARGDVDAAIRGYRFVVARYPLPEYVIALGDLYTVSGEPVEARRQYDLVRAEERLFRANGVNVDLEIALFDADHRVDLPAGLAAARLEWGRRRSVQVADALAWALHATGRDREALAYANEALRLGTRSALFRFHRAMIERSLGRPAAARSDLSTALAINPRFSILWSGPAARALASPAGGGLP